MRHARRRIAMLAGGAVLAALGGRPAALLAQPTTSGYPARAAALDGSPVGAAVTGPGARGGTPGVAAVGRPAWKPQVIATARPVTSEPAGPKPAVVAPVGMTAPGVAAASSASTPGVRVSASLPGPGSERGREGPAAAMPRVEGPDPPDLLPGLDGPGSARAARGLVATAAGRAAPGTAAAALSVEKVAPASASAGLPLAYEIVVHNAGGAPALGVRIEEQLPSGAKLVTSEPVAEVRGQTLAWQVGRLAAGADARIRVQVQPAGEGEFVSTALLTSSSSCTVRVPVARAGLAVALEAPPSVRVGDVVPLRIRLGNGLATPVKRLVLRVRLPEGLKHPAGEYIEAELPGLAAGEKTAIPLEARAAAAGKQQSLVSVMADGAHLVTAVAVVQVEPGSPGLPAALAPGRDRTANLEAQPVTGEVAARPAPRDVPRLTPPPPLPLEPSAAAEDDLVLKVSGQQSQVEIGEETVYEVRVVNTGSRAVRDVRVRVQVPDGLEVLQAGGLIGPAVKGHELSFAPLAQVAGESSVVWPVRVRAARAGEHRVRAWLEGNSGGGGRGEAVLRATARPDRGDRMAGPSLGDLEGQQK